MITNETPTRSRLFFQETEDLICENQQAFFMDYEALRAADELMESDPLAAAALLREEAVWRAARENGALRRVATRLCHSSRSRTCLVYRLSGYAWLPSVGPVDGVGVDLSHDGQLMSARISGFGMEGIRSWLLRLAGKFRCYDLELAARALKPDCAFILASARKGNG